MILFSTIICAFVCALAIVSPVCFIACSNMRSWNKNTLIVKTISYDDCVLCVISNGIQWNVLWQKIFFKDHLKIWFSKMIIKNSVLFWSFAKFFFQKFRSFGHMNWLTKLNFKLNLCAKILAKTDDFEMKINHLEKTTDIRQKIIKKWKIWKKMTRQLTRWFTGHRAAFAYNYCN